MNPLTYLVFLLVKKLVCTYIIKIYYKNVILRKKQIHINAIGNDIEKHEIVF